MSASALEKALSDILPKKLAGDLVSDLLALRREVATTETGKGTAGKFVESIAQSFQFLATASYDSGSKLNVDKVLRSAESWTTLPEDLRICGARIARSMYSLRSKRNIVHKGDVDPNVYDLRFLLHCAQWLVTELVRIAGNHSVVEAGQLVSEVQAPVGGLVDDFGERHLVLRNLSVRNELLLVLQRRYPERTAMPLILKSMDRRSKGSVYPAARKLWEERLVDGDGKSGYILTTKGLEEARRLMEEVSDS